MRDSKVQRTAEQADGDRAKQTVSEAVRSQASPAGVPSVKPPKEAVVSTVLIGYNRRFKNDYVAGYGIAKHGTDTRYTQFAR